MALAALVLAIIALAVSIWAALSNHRMAQSSDVLAKLESARRQDEETAKARAETASRRADLRLRHEPSGQATTAWLVVVNNGPANARNVTIVGDHPGDVSLMLQGPIAELRSGDEVRLGHALNFGSKADVQFRLSWDDDEGHHEESRSMRLT